jgi:hypothetical protein
MPSDLSLDPPYHVVFINAYINVVYYREKVRASVLTVRDDKVVLSEVAEGCVDGCVVSVCAN